MCLWLSGPASDSVAVHKDLAPLSLHRLRGVFLALAEFTGSRASLPVARLRHLLCPLGAEEALQLGFSLLEDPGEGHHHKRRRRRGPSGMLEEDLLLMEMEQLAAGSGWDKRVREAREHALTRLARATVSGWVRVAEGWAMGPGAEVAG